MKNSILRGEITFKKPEGTDKKYLSIKDIKSLDYQRNPDKVEANIFPEPDGTVIIAAKKQSVVNDVNVYDKIINSKVTREGAMPKFTFETQELYE